MIVIFLSLNVTLGLVVVIFNGRWKTMRRGGVGVGGRIRDLISLCDLDILLLPPSAKAAAAARSKLVRAM